MGYAFLRGPQRIVNFLTVSHNHCRSSTLINLNAVLHQERDCGGLEAGDRDKLDLLYLSAIGTSSLTVDQIKEYFPSLAPILSASNDDVLK